MKNKIGWCSMTFNPVWGCLNHCEYCYARKIAKRFANRMAIHEIFRPGDGDEASKKINNLSNELMKFIPTFLNSQYYKKFPKKPQRIFVGSMSEIAHWEKEWMEKVLDRIKLYPQHVFQFLTRYPDIYFGKYKFPLNCWLGATITRPLNTKPMGYSTEKAFNMNKDNLKFISFEPLLERIEPKFKVDWVIIGAETGNRRGKVIPKKEWIENIVDYCRKNNIPIYLKDSLKDIYPVEVKEFPKTEL
jgi:protein gp37